MADAVLASRLFARAREIDRSDFSPMRELSRQRGCGRWLSNAGDRSTRGSLERIRRESSTAPGILAVRFLRLRRPRKIDRRLAGA